LVEHGVTPAAVGQHQQALRTTACLMERHDITAGALLDLPIVGPRLDLLGQSRAMGLHYIVPSESKWWVVKELPLRQTSN
jgi:hypothetical protein